MIFYEGDEKLKKFRRFDVGRKKLKKSTYVFVIFSFLNI